MEQHFVCRVPTLEEMAKKWDADIQQAGADRNSWIIWKEEFLDQYRKGRSLPFYGFLDGEVISMATAILHPDACQNSQGLVDACTAYLCAFRTEPPYQGQGYFSQLFHAMVQTLKQRGYRKVTLGVEPQEEKNQAIYRHYGFDTFLKQGQEVYPNGRKIQVAYYQKAL